MKNLSNKQLLLIRKCIGVGCAVVCLFLMFLNMFKYTSSTSLSSGNDAVTWSEGISLYNFLFNGDKVVLYDSVEYLREIFAFSHVIMWISFIASVLALGALIYGAFSKKILFSKIGSIGLVCAIGILILISFDSYSIVRTTKYLSIFTPVYLISLVISIIGLFSIVTISDNK